MFMLIKNVKPKLPKLVWALRKQFGPETLIKIPERTDMPNNENVVSSVSI